MRVQEKDSESCAKMTEEMSMNGGPDSIPSGSKRGCGFRLADGTRSPNLTATSDSERTASTLAGGRLKFFKDGKFILELSHRKEGERTSWVPVPKKTYWPPPGAAGTPRQESSTSLSVSDDNSSVQSSPWQRDHCWKQSNPRHNVNKEMAFFMRPPHHAVYVRSLGFYSKTIRRKRRCPYDIVKVNVETEDINDVKPARSYKRTGPNPARLTLIVQTLMEKVRSVNASGDNMIASNNLLGNHMTNCASTSRLDPSIVSPRKRILREMERVSLEDQANSKRQRARPGPSSSHATNNGSGNCTVTCHTQVLPSPPPQLTHRGSVSNYSITSLLGPMDEATPHSTETESPFLRTLLKSPPSPSVSPRPQSSVSVKTSPSPVPSPPESHRNHRSSLGVPSMSSAAHMSPFLTPGPSFLYPASYLPHHPYYSPLHSVPAPYRGSPHSASPLWLPYPLSSREGIYPGLMPPCHPPPMSPCNWGPAITHHPLADMKRDDTCSDVPLNLSKHAS